MAANNDYQSSFHNQWHPEAPLPPVPSPAFDQPDQHPTILSSVSSPYGDSLNRGYGRRSDQSLGSNSAYYGVGGGGPDHEPNHYADDIPLRQHPSKGTAEPLSPDYGRYEPASINNMPHAGHQPVQARRKKRWFGGRVPWVTYTFTIIQITVFIAALVRNGVLTKSPIEIHPQFNPMIGPSPYVLINMGARYIPCMRATPQIQNNPELKFRCPNSTSSDNNSPMNQCTLSQLCGFGDNHSRTDYPRQWYRFIIPMFLHAGFVHIGFNMLLQLTMGREMEKDIGSLRYALVYLSSGIFGFVLGGNFAPEGIASSGASGCLFGVIALVLLDLLYHWSERRSPWIDLAWISVGIIVSFVLGLLPGLDNFSHIGGFLMGLVLGICLLHSPDRLRQRVGADKPPYAPVGGVQEPSGLAVLQGFVKQPVGFFKGRRTLWWAWWLVRTAALIGVLVCFIILLKNFYRKNPQTCSWCKHLSCLPVHHWCDIGKLTVNNETKNSTTKRDLLGGVDLSPFFGD